MDSKAVANCGSRERSLDSSAPGNYGYNSRSGAREVVGGRERAHLAPAALMPAADPAVKEAIKRRVVKKAVKRKVAKRAAKK